MGTAVCSWAQTKVEQSEWAVVATALSRVWCCYSGTVEVQWVDFCWASKNNGTKWSSKEMLNTVSMMVYNAVISVQQNWMESWRDYLNCCWLLWADYCGPKHQLIGPKCIIISLSLNTAGRNVNLTFFFGRVETSIPRYATHWEKKSRYWG